MGNPFDQFDQAPTQPANPFDQFDAAPPTTASPTLDRSFGTITATPEPTMFGELGRAVSTLFNDPMGRPPIARIDDAIGIVGDAITPDALQRGFLGGKRDLAQTLPMVPTVYGPAADQSIRETDAASIARAAERYAPSAEDAAALQALSNASTVEAWASRVAETPGVIGDVILESIGRQFPALTVSAVNPVAGIAAAGTSSYNTERLSAIDEAMQQAGVDLTDPIAVSEFKRQNPELIAAAEERGKTRGAIIGTADALTAGLAGRFFRNTGLGNAAKRTVADGILGVGGGAGGEAAAQLATDGRISSLGDVLTEAVAEGPSTVIEGAANAMNAGRAPADAQPQPAPTPTPAPSGQAAPPLSAQPQGAATTPPPIPPEVAQPAPPAPAPQPTPSPSAESVERPQQVQAVTGQAGGFSTPRANVVPVSDGVAEIRSADGALIGNLLTEESPEAITIRGIELSEGQRGQGIGGEIYRSLADRALSSGRVLRSDTEVSPDAQAVYASLERQGYTVVRGQAPSGDPTFEVTAGPGAVPQAPQPTVAPPAQPAEQPAPDPQAAAPAPASTVITAESDPEAFAAREARVRELESRVRGLSDDEVGAALAAIDEKPRPNRDPRAQLMAQHPDDIDRALAAVAPAPPAEPQAAEPDDQSDNETEYPNDVRKKWDSIERTAARTGWWSKASSVESSGRVESAGRRVVWRYSRYAGDEKPRLEVFDPNKKQIHDYGSDPAAALKAIDDDIKAFAGSDLELSMALRTVRREALRPDADAKPTKPPRRGKKQSDALMDTADTAPMADEADRPLIQERQNTRSGTSPTMDKASSTMRRSWQEQAFVDLGLDPDKANLLPIGEQFKMLSDLVKMKYGFQGIFKDATLTGRRAVDQMLDAYVNLQAMASVLSLPASAMSVGNKLTLVLSGKLKAFGLFAPEGYKIANVSTTGPTIALRGRSNSFSHEWWHAIDFDLASKVGDESRFAMLSTRVRQEGLSGDTDVEGAFVNFMNAVFYDDAALANEVLRLESVIKNGTEKQAATAKEQLDALLSGRRQPRVRESEFARSSGDFAKLVNDKSNYWKSAVEMTARAFEAYLGAKLADSGARTEFVNKGDLAYLSEVDKRLAMTFPKAEDRLRIFLALDDLFRVISNEQLLAKGAAEKMPKYENQFDPRIFNSASPTPLDRSLSSILKREYEAFASFMADLKRRNARPKRQVSILNSATDLVMMGVSAMKAHARTIERRYPKSQTLRELFDLVVDAPGTTRKADPMYRRIEVLFNQYNNRFGTIFDNNRLDDPVRQSQVIALMRGTLDPEQANPAAVRAAALLRRFSDTMFDEQDRAGIKVGYASNYLSRVIDAPVAMASPDRFVEQAEKAYAAKFDREIAGNEAKLAEVAQSVKIKPDEDGNFDVDAVRETWTQMRAQAYLYGIQHPSRNNNANGTVKPAADHLMAREFGPEADEFLSEFYVNDVKEVFHTYIAAMARRVAYAERFGADGEKLKKMMDKLRSDGIPDQHVRMIGEMLPVAWGEPSFPDAWNSRTGQLVARGMNIISTPATIVLLARQVLSQIPEQVAVVNTLADRKVDALSPGRNLLNAAGSIYYTIKAMAGRGDMRDFEAIVEYAGLLTRTTDDHLVEQRIGNAYDIDPTSIASRIRSTAFQNTFATGLTRMQRLGVMRVVTKHLHLLAWRLKNDPSRSRVTLDELAEAGVENPVAMAEWLLQDDNVPTLNEMLNEDGTFNPQAADYFKALNYLTNMAYQNPAPYERANFTNNPFGSVINSITAYATAFYENQIKRQFKVAGQVMMSEKADGSGSAKAASAAALYLANSGIGWAMLFAGNLAFFTMRQYLTNSAYMQQLEDEDEEEERETGVRGTKLEQHLIKGATEYTLSLGPLEKVKGYYLGARFEADAKATILGPHISYYATNVDRIMEPQTTRSERTMTNTPEYIRMQGVYGLFIAPTAGVALNVMPGGPLLGSAQGLSTMYLTSPGARDAFAEGMVGERGTRVPEKEQARAEEKARKQAAERAGRGTGRETGRARGGERETGR